MNRIYKNSVNNFTGIRILAVRQGSVVVEHKVLLRLENGKNLNNSIFYAAVQIKDILMEAKNCTQGDRGCLGVAIIGDVVITNLTYDKESVCTEAGLDKNLLAYYYSAEIDGRLICASPCVSEHNTPKHCNTGTCSMSHTGPVCSCNKAYWYIDSDCYGPIRKTDVLAALLTLAVLVIVAVVTIVVYVLWRRRQTRRSKDMHTEQVNDWLEDDFEWPDKTSDLIGSSSTTVLNGHDSNQSYGGRVGLQYSAEGESSMSFDNANPPSHYQGTHAQGSGNPYSDNSSWEDRSAIEDKQAQPKPTTSVLPVNMSHPESETQFRISRPQIKSYSEV
ncbi:hypothetical protein DPEC_G00097360 [Dallia pectoralis]|uniref:Uncharacterized protein n=1 Tax=Dallia pectoralis TaxID=75939 RepID=A0ACC2GVQ7_DALPE|nr:hypothetical protein DPEC_G00097360 [Dallia pectoralis]